MSVRDRCHGSVLYDLDHIPGGGWVKDPEETGAVLLRPDFTRSFLENYTWHTAMVKFVREHGNNSVPTYSKDELREMPKEQILECLSTAFAGAMKKYRHHAAVVAKTQNNKSEVSGDEAETTGSPNLPPEVASRRYMRKKRVFRCLFLPGES